MKANKKILVLGSTGFIGTNLVKYLIASGEEVLSFSTRKKGPVSDIEHITGDIRDQQVVRKLLKNKPDTIISLVGMSGQASSDKSPQEYFDVNVKAHIDLLNQILKHSPEAKFIFSSSRLEYGKPIYLPVDEIHPVNPISHYGVHKSLISSYCQFLYSKYSLKTVVLRSSNPYGPCKTSVKAKYNIINHFIHKALKGKHISIYGQGRQKRDYFYIEDLIRAIVLIIKSSKASGQIYNLGGGKGIALHTMVKNIIKTSGKGKIKYLPWPKAEKGVETGDYISDITKIYRHTGWQPKISYLEGIKRTVQEIIKI